MGCDGGEERGKLEEGIKGGGEGSLGDRACGSGCADWLSSLLCLCFSLIPSVRIPFQMVLKTSTCQVLRTTKISSCPSFLCTVDFLV